jgi:hypothetical protein
MKAFVQDDLIISITEEGDTEIYSMPKGVGLERLRFDGEKVIDLADLSEFWVLPTLGGFELHCIEVANSHLIQMAYSDRKYLTLNSGNIRLKTQEEIDAENYNEKVQEIKTKQRAKIKLKVGDIHDQHMNTLAFVCALIVYSRQQPQALADFFDQIIPDIKDMFPLNRVETILKNSARDLKVIMQEYWQDMDGIQ